MKILVTGGAGYIGSILVPALLREKHIVTVIDDFRYNQSSLLDCCYNTNLKIIRGDVRNRTLMQEHIKNADIIIPLACLVGAPLCDQNPVGARTINYDAVKMILELRYPSQRIIFPTTNSGYGIGQKDKFCTEDTPLKPVSLYGKLKVKIENELLSSGNCITLRLATVFGISPRMRLDLLVNDFVYRAFNDRTVVLFQANFKRNYIHVRDVASSFIHCITNFEKMKNEPYNVGLSSANLSKYELCEKIREVIPDFYPIISEIGEDPDKRDYIVSNEKIEKTGWKPKFSLDKGIKELIKGFQIIKKNKYSNI